MPQARTPPSFRFLGCRVALNRANWSLPPTAQMPLEPVSQVLHQVEAVGDLPRLWSALTRCVGVETITIRSLRRGGLRARRDLRMPSDLAMIAAFERLAER
jgi:hypothetical protein